MNYLSWLLYLASVSGTLKGLALLSLLVISIVFAVQWLMFWYSISNEYDDDDRKKIKSPICGGLSR